MARNRKAEKIRRLSSERRERLEAELGVKLSTGQLAGRPNKGELPISALRLRKKGSPQQKLEYVTKQYGKGKSVTAARKEIGLSERQYKKLTANDPTYRERSKGRIVITPKIFPYIDRFGDLRKDSTFAGENRKQMFAWRDALADAYGSTPAVRKKGKEELAKFRTLRIVDVNSKRVYPAYDFAQIDQKLQEMDDEVRNWFDENKYLDLEAAA